MISGASYDPQILHGKSHEQVAAALSDSTSPIAQAVDGTANVIAASICAVTGGKPVSTCASPAVAKAEAMLAAQQ